MWSSYSWSRRSSSGTNSVKHFSPKWLFLITIEVRKSWFANPLQINEKDLSVKLFEMKETFRSIIEKEWNDAYKPEQIPSVNW